MVGGCLDLINLYFSFGSEARQPQIISSLSFFFQNGAKSGNNRARLTAQWSVCCCGIVHRAACTAYRMPTTSARHLPHLKTPALHLPHLHCSHRERWCTWCPLNNYFINRLASLCILGARVLCARDVPQYISQYVCQYIFNPYSTHAL